MRPGTLTAIGANFLVFAICSVGSVWAAGPNLRLAQAAARATKSQTTNCRSAADGETACGAFSLVAGSQPITNGDMTLGMESNGNLVLQRGSENRVLWQSDTVGECAENCVAIFQADGNLVLYKNGKTAYWNTTTYGNPNAQLILAPAPPYLSIRTTKPKQQPFLQFGKTSPQYYLPGQILWAAGQNLNWLAPLDPFGGYGVGRPGAPDFMQLFQEGAPGWKNAFSHINILKLYTQNFVYFQDKSHSPEPLRTIVDFAKAHNLALAIEAEPVTCVNQTVKGEGVGLPSGPAAATAIALEIRALGGKLAYAAMDEPVDFFNKHGVSCPLKSLTELAENVANSYAAYQAVFPAIEVGDTEFGMRGSKMTEWATAYRKATGVSLGFYHDDAFQPGWQQSTPGLVAALRGAEGETGPGIPYGLIRNSGQPPGQSDRLWVAKAKANVDLYNSLGVGPTSQNVFQTWDPFPAKVLPETGDTLTNMVAYVFANPTAPIPRKSR